MPAVVLCGLAALTCGVVAGQVDGRRAPIVDLLDFPLGAAPPIWLRGTVDREPVNVPNGSRLVVRVEQVRLARTWTAIDGSVEVRLGSPAPTPNWLPGTEIEIHTVLRSDRPAANPGAPRHDRLRARGIDLRATLKHHSQVRVRAPPDGEIRSLPAHLRARVRLAIDRHQQAPLLRALLLGERDDIPDLTWQTLDRAGLLHLLAISGLHVGILVGAVQGGTRAAGATPRIASLGALGACFLALVLVAPRAPVRRASLSVACFLLVRLIGARIRAVDCLAAATVLQLIRAPRDVLDLGFQLTSIASLGLVLSVDSAAGIVALPALARASAAAQLWVAPLVAIAAAQLPVAAILVNVIAVPALAVTLPAALASVVATSIIPIDGAPALLATAAHGLGWATDELLALLLGIASAAATCLPVVAVPSAGWTVAGVYWTGLYVAARARPGRRAAGVVMACAAAGWAVHPGPRPAAQRLVAYDVGQGDALLLQNGRDGLLYDTGGFPGLDYDVGYHVLAPQLRRAPLGRLEAVAISHFHADHSGGVPGILRSIGVRELWTGATPPDAPDHVGALAGAAEARTKALSPVAARYVAGCEWEPLLPETAGLLEGARRVSNHASLALLVNCGRYGLLLAGDADAGAERRWASRLGGRTFAASVLKVAHHGSDTSTSEALLDALRPRHALISVGARNPWGLPRDVVLDRLRDRALAVYRTDRDGAITLRLTDRIRVSAERWVRPRY